MSWLTTTRTWLMLVMIELAWAMAGLEQFEKSDGVIPEDVPVRLDQSANYLR
jgi:hypothetical protein